MVLDDEDIQKIREIIREEITNDHIETSRKYDEIRKRLKEKEEFMGKEAFAVWIRGENEKHGWG